MGEMYAISGGIDCISSFLRVAFPPSADGSSIPNEPDVSLGMH